MTEKEKRMVRLSERDLRELYFGYLDMCEEYAIEIDIDLCVRVVKAVKFNLAFIEALKDYQNIFDKAKDREAIETIEEILAEMEAEKQDEYEEWVSQLGL